MMKVRWPRQRPSWSNLVGAVSGQERFRQASEQALENPQGKSPPRLAEGRTGEGRMALAGQVIECGVAVEHLEQEQMECIGGIEQPILPGVILRAAGGIDGVFVQERGHVLSNAAKDANKSVMQLHWRVLQEVRGGSIHPPVRRRALSRSTCRNYQPRWTLRPQVNDIRDHPSIARRHMAVNYHQTPSGPHEPRRLPDREPPKAR